jgi:CRISPR-associated protein (TIGR02710 family)
MRSASNPLGSPKANPDMATLLILTVGGSPDPLIYSILQEPRPDRVIFVCSEESAHSVSPQGKASNGVLDACARRGFSLGEGQIDRLVLTNPQLLSACIEEMERYLSARVADWFQRPGAVTVDATGGTKCMSMAAALVARRWPCTIRYVGGTARTDGGLGRVEASHEMRIDCFNPLDTLGHQLIEDALTLASRMSFESARLRLDPRHPTLAAAARRSVAALSQLLKVFADWDRFDHASALNALISLEKNLDDLQSFLSEAAFRSVRKNQEQWKHRLTVLANSTGPSRDLVEDLLANARRRLREGRFDDATARLYRAVEALAQWTLKSEFDIDTGNVLPEQLPIGFSGKNPTKPCKLGLQEVYDLLVRLNHPIGHAFVANRLKADPDDSKSPLIARNNSILAHGFSSIGEKACRSLWTAVTALAIASGIVVDQLLEFPALEARFHR